MTPFHTLSRLAVATAATVAALVAFPASAGGLAKVADAKAVSSCSYIDTVYSAVPHSSPERVARESVREAAAQRGATHVVWFSAPSMTYGGNQLAGKAYRCAT